MKQAFLVFVGGGFGSVLRFLLGKWLNNVENYIPYGTFLANVLGSLLIGFIIGVLSKSSNIPANQSLLLASGFCGGFTTFSTFAYENQLFLKNGDYSQFLFYTLGSLVFGFLAVFLGLYLSKLV
ncbi:fluoride efflux transporter CrcB [Lutibacter aestuarii]|uniref:Fluoride-specific ion channel FluC n=1 Tax=Lutibacter aestuarii TaxID=861111 RepID=A0ABW2Z308_9FLAO|nr:fluoride efflux transporter CrcB [uncultured Lutibacter sp.]